MKKIILILVCLTFNQTLFAKESLVPKGYSLDQIQEMSVYNSKKASEDYQHPIMGLFDLSQRNQRSPYAEFENAGYLFFSDDTYGGAATHIKERIAETLPEDVTLVVFTSKSRKAALDKIRKTYEEFIPGERLKVLPLQTRGNYFWARDGLPIPVWSDGDSRETMAVVDARYYHRFEADQQVADRFAAELIDLDYYFEGGNFVVNSVGDCVTVNRVRPPSITAEIPDEAFMSAYGCETLIRLPFLKGIGHADEVVKFIDDELILTDTEEYVEELEDAGFTVQLLPEADLKYETYVNSLQVNEVMYVPVFGEKNDDKVVEIYENLGFDVVPIMTRRLATRGQGGIHCITMTYPPVPFRDIEEILTEQ